MSWQSKAQLRAERDSWRERYYQQMQENTETLLFIADSNQKYLAKVRLQGLGFPVVLAVEAGEPFARTYSNRRTRKVTTLMSGWDMTSYVEGVR